MRAVVEDRDGIRHCASEPASTKRVNLPVTRRSTVCRLRVAGTLRDPAVYKVSCMGCLADDD